MQKTEPLAAQRSVGEACWMVGQRRPDSLLQCNTYLRTFRGKGRPPVHWCVDPGSQIDYPVVRGHLESHVGDLRTIQLFSINHQDPDVVGNLTYLTKENPEMAGLATEDTWRLVRHLNVHPKKMYFANRVSQNDVVLPGGHHIQIVATPFCHFRGAVAYYDPATQVLFSGDLCGGLNKPGRVQLFGEEEDWPGIAQFHQIYMPTRKAVAFAVRQIRALQPAVKIIAPQHGFVLQGAFMHSVLDRLEKLPVGLDLLSRELDERYLKAYQQVLQDTLDGAASLLGKASVLERFAKLPKEHRLHQYLKTTRTGVQLQRHGISALPLVLEELCRQQLPSTCAVLKSIALHSCIRHKAPLPQLGVGIEGSDN